MWNRKKKGKLTSSPLVNAIQTYCLALLCKSNEPQQDIELVAAQGNIAAAWRNYAHYSGLRVGRQLRRSQHACNAPGGDFAPGSPVVPDHSVIGLDVEVGHVGSREEVAEEIGT